MRYWQWSCVALAAMERQAILDEYEQVKQTIARLETILGDVGEVFIIIKQELAALKDKFGDQRRTVISEYADSSFSQEDLVPKEDVLITLTERGYVKRQPAGDFQAQRRGGKGIIGVSTRATDAVQEFPIGRFPRLDAHRQRPWARFSPCAPMGYPRAAAPRAVRTW